MDYLADTWVTVAGAAIPASSSYNTALTSWIGTRGETGAVFPPRRVFPVYQDANGKKLHVVNSPNGPIAMPFPGALPSFFDDSSSEGYLPLQSSDPYAMGPANRVASDALANSDRDGGGESPSLVEGVFDDLKGQIRSAFMGFPQQAAKAMATQFLQNALMGLGGSGLLGGLSDAVVGSIPGIESLSNAASALQGAFAPGGGGVAGAAENILNSINPSAMLSQLGDQVLGMWKVQDSDSMGEQLANHFAKKYKDQLKDPEAAMEKLKGYFKGQTAPAINAAVRMGDVDLSGDPVLLGSPTVYAEGQPLARVDDGVKPPGVKIYMGAATVMTNGAMTARTITSTSQAGGFMKGAATVFINGKAGGTPPPPAQAKSPQIESAKQEVKPAKSVSNQEVKNNAKNNPSQNPSGKGKETIENNDENGGECRSEEWRDRLKSKLEDENAQMTYKDPNAQVSADGYFSPEEHASRNEYNYCPQGEPGVGNTDGIDWERKTPDVFHRPLNCYEGTPSDGSLGTGSFECCYNDNGIVDNVRESGTYNFYHTKDSVQKYTTHVQRDVLPDQVYQKLGIGKDYDHVNSSLDTSQAHYRPPTTEHQHPNDRPGIPKAVPAPTPTPPAK